MDIIESEREINRLQEKCREYEKKMAHISVIDRWKIGEYLHDSLAQKLNYAKISINLLKGNLSDDDTELIEQCNEILTLVDEGIGEVRDLSHDVIPVEIGDEELVEAFGYLRKQIEDRHGVECELETGRVTKNDFQKKVISNLYHITQEAVKNAINHGGAQRVRIALFEHEEQLYLHVKDDGKGFDPSEKGGVGLDIMKYRANEIGGTFRIRDAKKTENFTTYITCTLPLEE